MSVCDKTRSLLVGQAQAVSEVVHKQALCGHGVHQPGGQRLRGKLEEATLVAAQLCKQSERSLGSGGTRKQT